MARRAEARTAPAVVPPARAARSSDGDGRGRHRSPRSTAEAAPPGFPSGIEAGMLGNTAELRQLLSQAGPVETGLLRVKRLLAAQSDGAPAVGDLERAWRRFLEAAVLVAVGSRDR